MSRAKEPDAKRARYMTLAAMTLANSMILIDQTSVPLAIPEIVHGLDGALTLAPWVMTANIIPLAAFMVLGGRLGDLIGLRRIFLLGALIFICASAMAGAAQDMIWLIVARAIQGTGAALMMPTGLAIVSAVFPSEERGRALGLLAGAAAFFAALGPVIGGLLTAVDWRLVFLINIPLAVLTVFLTLRSTPALEPEPGAERHIDYPGVATFGIAIAALVFALGQGQDGGWTQPDVAGPLLLALLSAIAFVVIEKRVENPLLEFRLFRHLNFLAANITQMLGGAVELGLGFLLPIYILEIIGVGPGTAGLMLIPASLPIILAGPLTGRLYDRIGGRVPLTAGFLILAAAGIALGLAATTESYAWLIPGLILEGTGLGIVLTANDPTGLEAVPEKDQGQAAGMINTTEQMGGALGIALLSAVFLSYYQHLIHSRLADRGIQITPHDTEIGRQFILEVQQKGLHQAEQEDLPAHLKPVVTDIVTAHADAYQLAFFIAAGIALLGAVSCFALVRRADRIAKAPVFSRRSRWIAVGSGRSAAITRRPPLDP